MKRVKDWPLSLLLVLVLFVSTGAGIFGGAARELYTSNGVNNTKIGHDVTGPYWNSPGEEAWRLNLNRAAAGNVTGLIAEPITGSRDSGGEMRWIFNHTITDGINDLFHFNCACDAYAQSFRNFLKIEGSILGRANQSLSTLSVGMVPTPASSGTHTEVNGITSPTTIGGSGGTITNVSGLRLRGLNVSAHTVTNNSTIHISGSPTGATNNYSIWVQNGTIRYDDNAPLGGGASPTLGTIGGTGPTAAAQWQWLKVTIDGTPAFLPVWR